MFVFRFIVFRIALFIGRVFLVCSCSCTVLAFRFRVCVFSLSWSFVVFVFRARFVFVFCLLRARFLFVLSSFVFSRRYLVAGPNSQTQQKAWSAEYCSSSCSSCSHAAAWTVRHAPAHAFRRNTLDFRRNTRASRPNKWSAHRLFLLLLAVLRDLPFSWLAAGGIVLFFLFVRFLLLFVGLVALFCLWTIYLFFFVICSWLVVLFCYFCCLGSCVCSACSRFRLLDAPLFIPPPLASSLTPLLSVFLVLVLFFLFLFLVLFLRSYYSSSLHPPIWIDRRIGS